MDSYEISRIVNLLGKKKLLTAKQKRTAYSILEEEYKHEISISWCIDDVYCRAEELEVELTEEQALTILSDLEHGHDACNGISWDTIDCYISMGDF